MAATFAILQALGRSLRRDTRSLRGVKVNNFFLFLALMVDGALSSGLEPRAAEPLLVVFAALLLLPLSSDPLGRIPRVRRDLWPLGTRERIALRLGGIAAAPTLWLAVFGAVLFQTRKPLLGMTVLLAAAAVQVSAPAIRRGGRGRALLPPFPAALLLLARANCRQFASTLDFWLAAAIALGGAIYRLSGSSPGSEALGIISLVVALALSTYAQCLFGMDRATSAMVRYRLLPVAPWEVLVSKDVAFLAVLLLFTALLNPLPAIAFSLVALAVGHYPSVRWRVPLERWRFTGTKLWIALVQGIGALIAGVGELRSGPAFLAGAAILYGASLYLCAANGTAREGGQMEVSPSRSA